MATAPKGTVYSNARRGHRFEVEAWSESLSVKFSFESKDDAEVFFSAVLRSHSVTAASFYEDGKFQGARDGAGS